MFVGLSRPICRPMYVCMHEIYLFIHLYNTCVYYIFVNSWALLKKGSNWRKQMLTFRYRYRSQTYLHSDRRRHIVRERSRPGFRPWRPQRTERERRDTSCWKVIEIAVNSRLQLWTDSSFLMTPIYTLSPPHTFSYRNALTQSFSYLAQWENTCRTL